MRINTGLMRVTGILLLIAAAGNAIALNSGRPSQSTCNYITNVVGDQPAGCHPVNYTLALILACVGFGLIVVSAFIRDEKR